MRTRTYVRYGLGVAIAALPRRDEEARAHLDNLGRRARPVVLARERVLAVPEPIGDQLPSGGLQRGTVTVVDGHRGAGATTLSLRLPPERWAVTVAALLDGVALVLALTPVELRPADARRLVARARERGAVLVALGSWPVEATMRLHVTAHSWEGLGDGAGLLSDRPLAFAVEGRGVVMRDDAPAARRFARAG